MKGIYNYLSGSHQVVFFSLLTLIALAPLMNYSENGPAILDLCLTFVLLATMIRIVKESEAGKLALVIALVALAVRWGRYLYPVPDKLLAFTVIFDVLFFLIAALFIWKSLFAAKKVTKDVLFGVATMYLFIGLIFALIYVAFYTIDPTVFHFPEAHALEDSGDVFARFLYFSFVTLTTLGYGDIYPLGSVVRSLSILEALAGQMILAIVIARFVGMSIHAESNSESQFGEDN